MTFVLHFEQGWKFNNPMFSIGIYHNQIAASGGRFPTGYTG